MNNELPTTQQVMADFDGRRVLVTGGTRGIGEAIVERLVRGGGRVITTGRSMSPGGSPDRLVQADVSTREGIDLVVQFHSKMLFTIDPSRFWEESRQTLFFRLFRSPSRQES